MIIDSCGCVWRGNPRDGYDLTTCVVHWLCDMFEAGPPPPLKEGRQEVTAMPRGSGQGAGPFR